MFEEEFKKLKATIKEVAVAYKNAKQERLSYFENNALQIDIDLNDIHLDNTTNPIIEHNPIKENIQAQDSAPIKEETTTIAPTPNIAPSISTTPPTQATTSPIVSTPQSTYKSSSNGSIKDSVGNGGKNNPEDIIIVQKLLNKRGYTISETNQDLKLLINTISKYQINEMRSKNADGRVDAGGSTMYHLLTGKKGSAEEIVFFKIDTYNEPLNAAATKYNIDPTKMKAIAFCESGGNASKGLMQVTSIAWEQVHIDFPNLKKYDYNTYRTNAEINLLFAAATLKKLEEFSINTLKIDKSHPNYDLVYTTCYNAGRYAVESAINNAKAAGSQKPFEDFLKEEFLKPAIIKYKLQRAYTDTYPFEQAVEKKYQEITGYYIKVKDTMQKMQNTLPITNPLENTTTNNTPIATHNTPIENNNSVLENIDIPRLTKAFIYGTVDIKGSVGQGGQNETTDVLIVKLALNKKGYLSFNFADINALIKGFMNYNKVDSSTIQAIIKFQTEVVKLSKADGRIDVNGKTMITLNNFKPTTANTPINNEPNKTTINPTNNTIPQSTPTNAMQISAADKKRIELAYKSCAGFISSPVGKNQSNNPVDVAIIKVLLYKRGVLKIDMVALKNFSPEILLMDNATIAAIETYQKNKFPNNKPDGVIDPWGRTFNALVEGNIILPEGLSNTGVPLFIGDSIAVGFKNASGGEGVCEGGASPKKVLNFLREAFSKFDFKNRSVYISTGLSNNPNMSEKSSIEGQLALLKQNGIKATVFGVSTTYHLLYPEYNPVLMNQTLANLCASYGMIFNGPLNNCSDHIHPRYYKLK